MQVSKIILIATFIFVVNGYSQEEVKVDSSTESIEPGINNANIDEELSSSDDNADESDKPKVLELSLDEAIDLALQRNLELKIQEFNPQLDEYAIQDALAAYIPSLRGNFSLRDASNPGGINPATNEPFPSNKTETTVVSPSINGLLPTGASYTIGFDSVKRDGDFIPMDRRFSGSFNFQARQPLLRNLWIDNPRRAVRVSRKNLAQTYSQFEQRLMQIVRNVEFAYYDLIAGIENVKVQEKALELGMRTLEENKTRVKVGVMAPLDETEAESQVANSRAALIEARQVLRSRENALKRFITDNFADIYDIRIEPTDTLSADQYDFDVYASWSQGLVRRPELIEWRVVIERQDINIKYAKNQMYPQLDLTASYSVNGIDNTYSGLWQDWRRRDDGSTFVGITLEIPLHNRGQRARFKQAQLQKQQFLLQMKDTEQRIQAEIADAVDSAKSAKEQVMARTEARKFASKALDVEMVKLANGKSTSFIVLSLQRDFTQRQADEISSLATYRRALTTLSFSEGTILERNKVFIDSKQKEPKWLERSRRSRDRYFNQ